MYLSMLQQSYRFLSIGFGRSSSKSFLYIFLILKKRRFYTGYIFSGGQLFFKNILKYFSYIFIFKNLTPYYCGPTYNLGVTMMDFHKLVMNQTLLKDAPTQNTAFLTIWFIEEFCF